MKKIMVVLAAMMMVMAMVGGAMAANEVTVNATVNSKCTVTGTDTENFGTIDPDNTAASVFPEITVKCTKGSTIHATCTSTSTGVTTGGNLLNGTSTIAYTIDDCSPAYQVGTTTSGFGASVTGDKVNLEVSIAANAAADAEAGLHSDTITVTVIP